MGVAQKTMFSISDHLAKFFGICGAPMEHNAIAKSKQPFFLQIRHKRPRTSSVDCKKKIEKLSMFSFYIFLDRKALKLHFTVLHFTKKTRKHITRAKKRPVILRTYCI